MFKKYFIIAFISFSFFIAIAYQAMASSSAIRLPSSNLIGGNGIKLQNNQISINPGSDNQLLQTSGGGVVWVATSSLGFGTVSSVGLSAPTGFTVSGSPINDSGVLSLNFTSGYELTLTASSTNWNNFYDTPSTRITAGTGLAWVNNTLNSTASSVVNTGTAGEIAYYASNGTALSATSSIFIDPYGKIGIGTTTPQATFDIIGSTKISGDLDMSGSNIVGVNKLTVITVDPLYCINGTNYSTYGAAIAGGVKEETLGTVELLITNYQLQIMKK